MMINELRGIAESPDSCPRSGGIGILAPLGRCGFDQQLRAGCLFEVVLVVVLI